MVATTQSRDTGPAVDLKDRWAGRVAQRLCDPPFTDGRVVASLNATVSKVVNLGRARKQRRRQAQEQRADANAVAFGRTKAEKLAARAEQQRLRDTVDGARRTAPPAECDEIDEADGNGEAEQP